MSKKEKKSETSKQEKAPGNKAASGGSLPALFDVSFSISKLVVLLIGVITAVLSVFSGATFMHAAIRGCLAMFAVGITLWLINWIMVRDSLAGVLVKMNKLQSHNSESLSGESTFEKNV